MTTSKSISRALALRIIHTLGESGTPPERGVTELNVGNASYFAVLEQEYLQLLLPEGGATFKLVQAYYGGGKTHFLLCLRDRAWAAGFVSAYVGLSPSECPFHETLEVYRAVVRQLRAPPPDDMALSPTTGLPDLLRDVVDDRRAAHGESAVRTWLMRTVRQMPVESLSLRNAVTGYCLACLDDDVPRQDILAAYLIGDDVPASAHRDAGVFEAIGRSNAFAMLRGVCQILRGLGFKGSVLLFDELDRNLSVGSTTKNRARLTDNLRELVDLCGRAALPGVMVAYAVPPEFLRNVVPDYPALQQRLASPLALSRRSPQATLIDLEQLDLEPKDLLIAMGERILELFQIARDTRYDPILQAANLARLAEEASQAQFEVSHRRIFVKTWIGFLEEQFAERERVISKVEMVERVMGGARVLLDAPGASDDDFVDF